MLSREHYPHPPNIITGRGLTDEQAIVRYFVLMVTTAATSVALRICYHMVTTSLAVRLRRWEFHRRLAARRVGRTAVTDRCDKSPMEEQGWQHNRSYRGSLMKVN